MLATKLGFLAPLAMAGMVITAPIVVAPLAPGVAEAASFDCARAANATEVAICGNARLSALDTELGAAFDARVGRDANLRQIERGWLAARDAGCGGDAGCLTRLTLAEVDWLRSAAVRLPRSLPTRPGACGQSAVRQIGTRLEGEPDSGSAVEETDGAYQVSYDTLPAVQAAQVGDAALVCLISVPAHCPPGDNRGRIYAVADLRTLGAWSAPDAEHSCGGA